MAPCSADTADSTSRSKRCSALTACGTPRSTPTHRRCSPRTGRTFPTSVTSPRSTGARWSPWTSSAEGSPARTSHLLAVVPASRKEPVVDSGTGTRTPFAFFDRESWSWRTSQLSLLADLESSSVIWPRWGTASGGAAFELPMPAHPIDESECSSLLLTPTTGDGTGGGRAAPTERGMAGKEGGGGLREQVRLLPSPRTSDTNGPGEHGTGGPDLRTAVALLPTPTTQPSTGNGHARNLGKEVALLPTPTAMDSAGMMTKEARAVFGHGSYLRDLPILLGSVRTPPPSPDGNASPDDPPRLQPTNADD
jgi:hypothetical protein